MQEWLNWLAWKASIPQKGIGGSNPPLSAKGVSQTPTKVRQNLQVNDLWAFLFVFCPKMTSVIFSIFLLQSYEFTCILMPYETLLYNQLVISTSSPLCFFLKDAFANQVLYIPYSSVL